MSVILTVMLFVMSFSGWTSVYVEGDILHPTLHLLNRTQEKKLDFRAGYVHKKWDLSLRYFEWKNISYFGGAFGQTPEMVKISAALDKYVSLRAGRSFGTYTFGAGVGSYGREFETSFGNGDKKTYSRRNIGLEAFGSYKWKYKSFFIKPEINFILAQVPQTANRSNGLDFYSISFEQPSFNFLALAGYEF